MPQQIKQPQQYGPPQGGQDAHWDYAQRPDQHQGGYPPPQEMDGWPQQQAPYPLPGGSHAAPPDPDGFFTPAHPQQNRPQGRGSQLGNVPPPYQGPVIQGPPQAEAPPPPPGFEPPDDRMIYQAPPRRRNTMVWLYIGLGLLVVVLLATIFGQMFGGQQQRTAVVTISEQGATYSGDALVVRNEAVFQQENVSSVSYTAEEGAAVNRGDPICTVYTAGFSPKELTLLKTYRTQIKDYQRVLLSAANVPDTQLQRLETTVSERAQETQALVRGAQGNLLNQELLLKEAISQRHNYLRQKYVEDTKLTRLYDNESNQLQRIETWTKQFAASDNGIVSFYTDGMEAALSPVNVDLYTPQNVRDLLAGQVPDAYARPKNTMDIYRLVRQYDWGALMLADDITWNPVIGDEYLMLIESFESTRVSVTVASITKSGGDLLVRLEADSPIEPILYIRSARVQLSKSVITYSVPASALINQDGVLGVVVQYLEGPYLVPVEVVSQDATQAHVVPVNAGHLYEGLTVRLF